MNIAYYAYIQRCANCKVICKSIRTMWFHMYIQRLFWNGSKCGTSSMRLWSASLGHLFSFSESIRYDSEASHLKNICLKASPHRIFFDYTQKEILYPFISLYPVCRQVWQTVVDEKCEAWKVNDKQNFQVRSYWSIIYPNYTQLRGQRSQL